MKPRAFQAPPSRRIGLRAGIGLAALFPIVTLQERAPAPASARNVLFVCIDTLRADRLGCYGHDRATSPHLDQLAARGQRFTRAYATAPWTLPSVASMMTGLLPDTHRANHFMAPVSPAAELLASKFFAAGFETRSFVGNYFLQPVFGLDVGFDDYDRGCLVDRAGVNSDCISDAVLEWLGAREGDRPFFLYLHYFDPHYNYVEHDGFEFGSQDTERVKSGQDIWDLREQVPHFDAADRARLFDLYDSEVAFTDHHLGRVLAALDERGLTDSTLIVLCADHGEELAEHGWVGHTTPLYEETVRIPMIFAGPGIAAGTCDRLVQLDDLLPTLLSYAGLPFPASGVQGRSLLPWIAAEPAAWPAPPASAIDRARQSGEAFITVETEEIPLEHSSADVNRRQRIHKDNWRIKVDVDEDGTESYRIFKTDEPDGTNKERDPRDHPEALAMLLAAIEEEYQSRLQPLLEAEAKRRSVVARRTALVIWPYKLIVDDEKGASELYDLSADQAESRDLASADPERAAAMRRRLDTLARHLADAALAPPDPIDSTIAKETREQLEALGYTR
jgi:arylsulfatase A-like enzyme